MNISSESGENGEPGDPGEHNDELLRREADKQRHASDGIADATDMDLKTAPASASVTVPTESALSENAESFSSADAVQSNNAKSDDWESDMSSQPTIHEQETKSYWPEPDPRVAPDEDRTATEAFQAGMMTVVEHLDELRNRLFRCLAYVAAGGIVGLLLAKKILRLLEAPAGNISFQALSLEEPVLVFFKVAFYAGVVFASPFILFEISRFVAPGLTTKERQIVTPIVIGSPLLFVCGGLFAYFCLLHPMLHFFGSFGNGVAPINQRLDFYISLVSSILLYMGLCFQLPIIIFALSFTGLVNSSMLIKIWRYAILGASLLAAIITPDPTAISMLIVMAALVGLYFLSVLLLKLFGR